MTTQKQQDLDLDKEFFNGAETAMLKAARLACRKAIETTGSVAIFRNGEIIREKDIRKIFPEDSESHSP